MANNNHNPSAPLHRLEAALTAEGFEAKVLPVSEDSMLEQVLVYLGQDAKDRDLYLQLLFLSDLQKAFPEESGAEEMAEENSADFLQFYAAYPFQVVETSYPDLARLILMLNRNIPLSGFGLDEAGRLLFCRQVLLCPDQNVDARVVTETVDLLAYYLDIYGEALEAVASGEKTLAQVIADAKQDTD